MVSEEKTLAKKQAILHAAFEVVYKEKINGANLRKIAKAAGMSPGNMHYYYPTKEALFVDLLDYLLQGFKEEQRTSMVCRETGAKERLSFILHQDKTYILHRKKMHVIMDFIINGTNNDKLHEKVRDIYSQWRLDVQSAVADDAGGGAISGKYADIMPALIIAIMDGAALQHLIYGDDFDLEKFYFMVREMILGLLS